MRLPTDLPQSSRNVDQRRTGIGNRTTKDDFTTDSQTTDNYSVLTPLFSMDGWFGCKTMPWADSSNQSNDKQGHDETSSAEEFSRAGDSTVGATTASPSVCEGDSYAGETATRSVIIAIVHSEVDSRDTESVSRADMADKRHEFDGTDASTSGTKGSILGCFLNHQDEIVDAPNSDILSSSRENNTCRPSQSIGRESAQDDESDIKLFLGDSQCDEECKGKSHREASGTETLLGLFGINASAVEEATDMKQSTSMVSSTGSAISKDDLLTQQGSRMVLWEHQKTDDKQSERSRNEMQKSTVRKRFAPFRRLFRWLRRRGKLPATQTKDFGSTSEKTILNIHSRRGKQKPRSGIPGILPKPKAAPKISCFEELEMAEKKGETSLQSTPPVVLPDTVPAFSMSNSLGPFQKTSKKRMEQKWKMYSVGTGKGILVSSKKGQKPGPNFEPLQVINEEPVECAEEPTLTEKLLKGHTSAHWPQPILKTRDEIDRRSGLPVGFESTTMDATVTDEKKRAMRTIRSIDDALVPIASDVVVTRSRKPVSLLSEMSAATALGDASSSKSINQGILSRAVQSDRKGTTPGVSTGIGLRSMVNKIKPEKSTTETRKESTKTFGTKEEDRPPIVSSLAAEEIRLAMQSILASKRLRQRTKARINAMKSAPYGAPSFGLCQGALPECFCSESSYS